MPEQLTLIPEPCRRYRVRVIDRLAWVTTMEARGRDEDEPIAVDALRRAGVHVHVVDWDDPNVAWSSFDRVVLRSAWDYPQRLTGFLDWLQVVDTVTDLLNPIQLVRWSLDKHYLGELAAAGVPITPTEFVEPGQTADFPVGEFVVKPAIGAGSKDASAYGPEQHPIAREHIERLHAQRKSVLVQPFLASVSTDGEWPLIFFQGTYSHAASKRVTLPRAGTVDDLFAAEINAAHVADQAQIETAQATIDVVSAHLGAPAYARADLVNDDNGRPCVLEVELIEPSLFLPHAQPTAIERIVIALAG